ncbi:alpha/beta fold hydrolase [Mycolicibacterium vanbaalenii]|uniref:alpha/beta fold hydrolase n=2 Tax=Mycolicibacterium vanbaalenii TaxID=110539 RepID=UPI001F3C098D|nr:alpha/beta hydrolase [Mycolicibacterium vanbaalenii]
MSVVGAKLEAPRMPIRTGAKLSATDPTLADDLRRRLGFAPARFREIPTQITLSGGGRNIADMDLFVRESGPAGAPAIVFLHGGRTSGWSWEPVVERMPGYRCLAPDLPQFGRSVRQGPFDIGRAADAVAELIRSRVHGGRAHLVGFSLGAQVGTQLLVSEPGLVDRAVLSGTFVNTLPFPRQTPDLMGLFARTMWSRWLLTRRGKAREPEIPAASLDLYREDMRLATSEQAAQIVVASAGFTLPAGLDTSTVAALFVTGAKELPMARRWAAALARPMPHGVSAVATDMRHDWPLRHPDLFSRTVEGWLTATSLPREIALH